MTSLEIAILMGVLLLTVILIQSGYIRAIQSKSALSKITSDQLIPDRPEKAKVGMPVVQAKQRFQYAPFFDVSNNIIDTMPITRAVQLPPHIIQTRSF